MRFLLLYLLFAGFAANAQFPQLQGQWQLQSVTRSDGTIIYYDWNVSMEKNASPVVWGFDNSIAAILNDSIAVADKLPTDTVEAAHYRISGDTLILINYFTKGEAETSTNAPVVYYKIAQIDGENMLLILYDKVWGEFRPIDKYSKKYVFKRVVGNQ